MKSKLYEVILHEAGRFRRSRILACCAAEAIRAVFSWPGGPGGWRVWRVRDIKTGRFA